jgi:4-aminobutyrate aminotransferase
MASLTPAFGNKHITPGIGRLSNDLIIEKGQGTWVWTTDGKKWLDFTSGIVRFPNCSSWILALLNYFCRLSFAISQGVTCLGHAHPAITSAVTDQLNKISHSQVNIAHSLPQLQLIEKLIPVMPSPELDTFFS